MNTDRGQSAFTPDERQALRDQMVAFKRESGLTWRDIGNKSGVNHSTLSAICSAGMDLATYSDEQFGKIHRYFLMAATQAELQQQVAIVPGFQKTLTAQRIHNISNWARRGNICAVVGDPGVGKTASIDQYCASTPNCWKITAKPSCSGVSGVLNAVLSEIMPSNARTGGIPQHTGAWVRRAIADKEGVLFVDEAQFLNASAFEELRALHDATKVGLVFAGNRDVLSRIEGKARAAEFAQLTSRLGIVHVFSQPAEEDVEIMLAAWGITAPRETAFLSKIALRPGGGAIRQMSKILELATVSANNEDEERCLQHLEEAAVQLRAIKAA